jgi:hypothetical protein
MRERRNQSRGVSRQARGVSFNPNPSANFVGIEGDDCGACLRVFRNHSLTPVVFCFIDALLLLLFDWLSPPVGVCGSETTTLGETPLLFSAEQKRRAHVRALKFFAKVQTHTKKKKICAIITMHV